MKTLLLAATALASLAAGSALAADLPRRGAPLAPAPVYAVPVFTWTGFYLGANAGYGFGKNDNLRLTNTAGTAVNFRGDNNNDGFVGGGQAGFNYQMGMFVLGLETDIQYANLGDRRSFNVGGTTFRTKDADDYFGTLRGRAGVAFDRVLVYGTGGLAYGDVGVFGTKDIGWTAGGGVEYAFTNNWTAKVEGLYVSLDRGDVAFRAAGATFRPKEDREEFGVVRAGLNYKF